MSSPFIWQLLTFKGSIVFLQIALNKNSLKPSTPGSGPWKFSHEWKRWLVFKRVIYILKQREKLYHPTAVEGYLAWKRSPGALPHTAPSSWSVWDPWRTGPLHNPPPPTGKSGWPKWRPSPTRRGSARSTWLIPPKRTERGHKATIIVSKQSHVLGFSFLS